MAFGALTVLVVSGVVIGADRAGQPFFTAQARTSGGRAVLGLVAGVGDLVVALPVLGVVVLWSVWRTRSGRPFVVSVVTLVAVGVTVSIVKWATGRTAPGVVPSEVLAGGRSYPSGHAATAAVCLLLVALLLAEGTALSRRRLLMVASTLSLAVAWATVALGFHWVSDVLGGLLLGAFWAASAERGLGARPARKRGCSPR